MERVKSWDVMPAARNWTSADEMADEVSQHDNYIGGSMAKYYNPENMQVIQEIRIFNLL